MAVPVIMPRQGQSVETCIITRWLKKKGDNVKTGDILFSYETDKASFDAEAQVDGTIIDIFFHDGDEVPVLSNVAVIGNPGEDTRSFLSGSSENATDQEKKIVPPITESAKVKDSVITVLPSNDFRQKMSPRAKAMASHLGLNTASLKGSGPNGRIIVRDLDSLQQAQLTVPADSSSDYSDIKLSNIRNRIAKAMQESISHSAQLTHHMSADVRKMLALRNLVKAEVEKGSTPNITLNDMICFAVIKALEKFPEINSHFLGDFIRIFKKVDLGIAVDTPRGLMVPVVQNAHTLSLKGLSLRLSEVAGQCRKGEINPDLLANTAASFTISNLGNYGVEMFTPIVNIPQVAILGVNTILYRPSDLGNGIFGFIPVIGLSLTYDHRAVDGGPTTLFLREIKNQIESFDERI